MSLEKKQRSRMVPGHPGTPRRAQSHPAHSSRHYLHSRSVLSEPAVLIDSSSSSSSTPASTTVTIPRNLLRGSHGYAGLKPIKVKLFSTLQSANSAAAGALAFINSATFNSATFPELVDFAAIYDECRMLRFKAHYRVFPTVVSSAANSNFVAGAAAVSFDPTAGAPSSLANIMQESYVDGPCTLSTTTLQQYPSNERMRTISGRVPHLAPITSSDCPGSNWFCLDGGTAPILATFQVYYAALGTSGVISAFYQYELEMEFRLRT